MLTRVVKMEFNDSYIADFKLLFNDLKTKIIKFEGCINVELLQDEGKPNIFFTISVWQNIQALESYRNSDFFISTWKSVKINFSSKAEAWSLIKT
jgi:quinol monooxygenase YgiN